MTRRKPPSRVPGPKLIDERPQWTLKGAEITVELRNLATRAAKAGGQTQSAFVAQAVTRAAHARLKGEEEGGPLPVVVPSALEARVAAQEAAQAVQAATLQAALETVQEARRLGEAMAARADRMQGMVDELVRHMRPRRRGLLGLFGKE